MANKPATFKQVKELFYKLIRLFLDIIAKSGKFPSLVGSKTQMVIDMDPALFLKKFTTFINHGCKIGLMGVVDFDSKPIRNFRDGVLSRSEGFTGYHDFKLLKNKIKIVNKLRDGEESISGQEFLKRLIDDEEVLVNSNLLYYLEINQDDDEVIQYLGTLKDEVILYSFGDIFQEENGTFHVYKLFRTGYKYGHGISYLDDTSFDKTSWVLVFDKSLNENI